MAHPETLVVTKIASPSRSRQTDPAHVLDGLNAYIASCHERYRSRRDRDAEISDAYRLIKMLKGFGQPVAVISATLREIAMFNRHQAFVERRRRERTA